MSEWIERHGVLWQIRPIQKKSQYKLRLCSAGTCSTPATHYIVQKYPESTSESRSRNCERCARNFAKNAHLSFPELPVEQP
jgi:hypothetical protein